MIDGEIKLRQLKNQDSDYKLLEKMVSRKRNIFLIWTEKIKLCWN